MIDMYFVFMEDYRFSLLKEYEKYLSVEEIDRMGKFVLQIDRDQYLLTRVMARRILSQKLGEHFSTLVFENNLYGKPYLKNDSKRFSFNISHAAGLIVLAIDDNAATIGVDVENLSSEVDLNVRENVFSNEELLLFEQVPWGDQKKYFFDLWTLKESYMKAIGKGFSVAPKSCSFLLEHGKYQFYENVMESAPNEFSFQLFDLDPCYKVALCHKNENNEINSFRILPYWEVIDYKMSSGSYILNI